MTPRLRFDFSEIDDVWRALADPARKEQYQQGYFPLPDWFVADLDPRGAEYRDQQLSLWRAITGRAAYRPERDEDCPEISAMDSIYRPAFYATGDAAVAGDHLMALGHLLKRSGVGPKARILEYGAGFGQIALAFARLGATVETVDINPAFCTAISALSAHYRVDLTPHLAPFGFNPAGRPGAYDLIYFYESFHHCLEFQALLPVLHAMLAPDGRVLLAGEPIFTEASDSMPFPWGIRMDGENVAITRLRGWMELGFREDFLLAAFAAAGFRVTKYPSHNSHYATVYEFRRQ